MFMHVGYFFKKIDGRIKNLFRGKYVWDALKSEMDFEKKILGKVRNSEVGNVFIGKGTVVKPFSVIEDDVYIGENCVVGPHAFIRKGTIILDNCFIGRAEVKHSIIMGGVHAHHTSHILDSIIGNNCNIAAQFTTANLRFDNRNIVINGIDTGMRKMGVIMGDNTKTGIMSSTMPGTLIGPDSVLFPHKRAKGVYGKNSLIK